MRPEAIYRALRRFLSRSDQGFSPWAEDEAIPSAESALGACPGGLREICQIYKRVTYFY